MSPLRTTTAPLAWRASLPVSKEISSPPISTETFLTSNIVMYSFFLPGPSLLCLAREMLWDPRDDDPNGFGLIDSGRESTDAAARAASEPDAGQDSDASQPASASASSPSRRRPATNPVGVVDDAGADPAREVAPDRARRPLAERRSRLEAVEVEAETLDPLPEVRVVDVAAVARAASPRTPRTRPPTGGTTASAAACRAGDRGRLLATGKWRTQSRRSRLAISAQVAGAARAGEVEVDDRLPDPRRGRGRRARRSGPGSWSGPARRRRVGGRPRTRSGRGVERVEDQVRAGDLERRLGGVRPGDGAVPVDQDQRAVACPSSADRRRRRRRPRPWDGSRRAAGS